MGSALQKETRQVLPILKVLTERGGHPPVTLDRDVCVIGRGGRANLTLDAPNVSKLHALIVREQGRVYVRDLASTNGVEHNGATVREAVLADADVVRIGSVTLGCESGFGARHDDTNGEATTEVPTAELRTDDTTFSLPAGQQTALIGRRGACEVRLSDPSVWPVHAIILEIDGRRYVQDFSGGETRVNGQAVRRAELNPGDELRIGAVRMSYALAEPVDAQADDAPTETEMPLEAPAPLEALAPLEVTATQNLEAADELSEATPAPADAPAPEELSVPLADESPDPMSDDLPLAQVEESLNATVEEMQPLAASSVAYPAPQPPPIDEAALEEPDDDELLHAAQFDVGPSEAELEELYNAEPLEPPLDTIDWDAEVPPETEGLTPAAPEKSDIELEAEMFAAADDARPAQESADGSDESQRQTMG